MSYTIETSLADRIRLYADVGLLGDEKVETPEDMPAKAETYIEGNLTASWQKLKGGFKHLGERVREGNNQIRAIGHLAVLDVQGASEILSAKELKLDEPAPKLDFKERIRGHVLEMELRNQMEETWQRLMKDEEKEERRHRRHVQMRRIKAKLMAKRIHILTASAAVGVGALAAYPELLTRI